MKIIEGLSGELLELFLVQFQPGLILAQQSVHRFRVFQPFLDHQLAGLLGKLGHHSALVRQADGLLIGIPMLHGLGQGLGEVPLPGDLDADLLVTHPQHIDLGIQLVHRIPLDQTLDLFGLLGKIEGDQDPAQIPQHGGEEKIFGLALVHIHGHFVRQGGTEHGGGDQLTQLFRLGLVLDMLEEDQRGGKGANGMNPQHHDGPGDRADAPRKAPVEGGIDHLEDLVGQREVLDDDAGDMIHVLVAGLGHGIDAAHRLGQHRKVALALHAAQEKLHRPVPRLRNHILHHRGTPV